MPRLLAEGTRFDLAFIDGSHVFERVLSDLVHADGLVRNGGVVFIDDVQLASVRRAVEICVRDFAWQVEEKGEEGAAHHWLVARTSSDLRDASRASGRQSPTRRPPAGRSQQKARPDR